MLVVSGTRNKRGDSKSPTYAIPPVGAGHTEEIINPRRVLILNTAGSASVYSIFQEKFKFALDTSLPGAIVRIEGSPGDRADPRLSLRGLPHPALAREV